MDYEWFHYIEDMKQDGESRTDIKELVQQMRFSVPETKYKQMKNLIRGMLSEYRKRGPAENRFTEELVKLHGQYCQLLPDSETAKCRHNVMVYRYMLKSPLSNKAVAFKMGMSVKTVHNYLDKGIEELVIMCFGTPVLSCLSCGQQEKDGIENILDNYQLIQISENLNQDFFWSNWKMERSTCIEMTKGALQGLERLFSLYEEFAKETALEDYQRRPLEVAKLLYIDGKKDIAEVGDEFGLSLGSVYSDIRKITERLEELADTV